MGDGMVLSKNIQFDPANQRFQYLNYESLVTYYFKADVLILGCLLRSIEWLALFSAPPDK